VNAKSKRTQVIFWLIIIGLLISMLIAFTPTLNGLFGNNANQLQKGAPSLLVNGETLYELDVAQAQQNPPFNQGFQGEVGEDLNILLVDSLVQNTLLNQAASTIKVSDGDVRAKVSEFREQQGLAGSRNDNAYLSLISQYGFNDQTFRRQRVKVEKFQESLTEDVTVSDAEVEAFYNLNLDNYNSEEKIKARVIVLDDPNKADEILAKAKAGDDFGVLAKDNSLERADRNGALGAAEGSTDPQPVGRAALPTEVANAAFALEAAGITEIISASEKFYITKVEEYIAAAPEPLDTIKERVQEEALDAKKAGVLEQSYTDLRNKAQISIPEGSTLTFNDTAVAKVGDMEIKRSELAQAVYLSPQIQQALSPGLEQIVTGMFKPT
jgi:parvulin-like peptidyl-prolyl isomerase